MARSRAIHRCALLALAIGLLSIGVAAPAAGAAGAAESGATLQDDGTTADDPDVTIDVDELDGDSVWKGQTVALEGFESDETVRFTHESGIRQRTADADGRLVADTSRWSAGSWSVTANESNVDGDFELREQTLDASVEPTAASETATIVLDSNRVDYDVAVDATGLTAADLAAVFDDGWTSDGQFYLTAEENGGEYSFDAAALQAGDYQFGLSVTDTTAEATASVNVTSELRIGEHEPRPHENSSVLLDVTGDGSVGQGDVATFFQRQHRSAWKRPALFDFSDNGAVTHGDVVVLADYVATGQLPAEPNATFVGGPFSEEAGDVAEIPVDVEGTDEAWVNVSLADHDYTATVHLEDVGDETTIEANTFLMGHGEAEGTIAGDDVAGFTETGELSQLLAYERFDERFEFHTRAYTNDPREVAEATDVSQLSLDERATDNLTTYAAPADALEGDVEELAGLLESATASDALTREDVLLVEVNASGLYGYLQADASSYDDTAGDLAFTFATDEETPVGTQTHTEDLADLDGAELVVDEDEDRFVVAVPAGEIEFSDYVGEFGAGDGVDVSFEVGPDNPYVAGDEPERVTDSVAFEPAVEFVDGPYAEQEGDVAEIPVAVDSADGTADEAWVTVSAADHDYAATVRLEDVDGETTIEANTFRMGHDEAAGAFSGEDVVGVTESGAFADLAADERFQDGAEFRLEAYATEPSDGTSADDDEAGLTLEDRSTDALTTYVAPSDVDPSDAEEPSDLLEHATRSDTVAEGDLLIAEVEASGVYGSLNETTGFASHEGVAFTVTHERTDAFGNVREHTAELGNLSEDALVVDEEGDRFLVAISPFGLSLDGHTVESHDSIDVSLEVTGDSAYVPDGENESVTNAVSVEELRLEFDGYVDENGSLRVSNTEDAEIVVQTNAAPGTEGEFYMVLQDATASTGFLTVDEDGELVGEFDFRNREHGEEIQVIEAVLLRAAGDETLQTGGVFVDGDADPEFVASGTSPASAGVGEHVELDTYVENQGPLPEETTVTVSVDGEVVHDATVELAPGEIRSQSYEIPTDEPGEVTWEIEADGSTDSGTVTIDASDP